MCGPVLLLRPVQLGQIRRRAPCRVLLLRHVQPAQACAARSGGAHRVSALLEQLDDPILVLREDLRKAIGLLDKLPHRHAIRVGILLRAT